VLPTPSPAPRTPDARADGAVEAAFAQVLGAQEAAREAIVLAQAQAAALAEAARAETRQRAERTRRHIAAVHAAFERRLLAELARIADAAEALTQDAPLGAADRAHVADAVAELAATLTSPQRATVT
jgi:hypothetical protein